MIRISNLLNGKQLVENGSKHDQSTPTKGPKSIVSCGSWIEKQQIESALDDRKHALQHQRIEKTGSLAQATWIEDKQKALVTERKGPYWLHMGHVENRETFLYPEEIIHLMEMNALDLNFGGVRMSMQQAYSKFVGKNISMNEYRVYSDLSRQGYKLIRHDRHTLYHISSEDSSDDVEFLKENASCSKYKHSSTPSPNKRRNSNIKKQNQRKDSKIKTKNKEDIVYLNESSSEDCTMVSDFIDLEDASEADKRRKTSNLMETDNNSMEADVVCLPSFSLKLKILSKIPNCFQKKYLSLTFPDNKYIPKGVNSSKSTYILSLDEFKNLEAFSQENSNNLKMQNRLSNLNMNLHLSNVLPNNYGFFNIIMQNILMNRQFSNMSSYRFSNQSRPPIRNSTQGKEIKVDITQNTPKIKEKEEKPHSTRKETISKKPEINVANKEMDTDEIQTNESVVSKKDVILNSIKLILSKFSETALGSKSSEIKEALILAIIKFNDMFNERYTLVFKGKICLLQKMPVENDDSDKNVCKSRVLELSSDYDSPPEKVSKRLGNSKTKLLSNFKKKKRRRKTASYNIVYSSSSDESSTAYRNSLNPRCSSTRAALQNWYLKGPWINPDIGKTNKKTNYISGIGLRIATAILNNIKELSYKKDCPIESWSQGKELYKNKITSNVVCISDDEANSKNSTNAPNDVDNISPLLCKEDCTSVNSIMQRLQIVESLPYSATSSSFEDTQFRIAYDVYYATDKTLRKSELPTPPLSLLITSDKSPLPTPEELSRLRQSLHKNVSLLLAVVSFDTISYIQMENITLPSSKREKNDNSIH